jgi:hypothetical protein
MKGGQLHMTLNSICSLETQAVMTFISTAGVQVTDVMGGFNQSFFEKELPRKATR